MPAEVEIPLPSGIWLSELRKLSDCCVSADGDTEDRAVRRAFHFLKLSPPAISRAWASEMSEGDMETMLEQGKAQEAACGIVGSHTEVELSAGGKSRHVAVLHFDDGQPVRAEAATPALAMISAWARLLSGGAEVQALPSR